MQHEPRAIVSSVRSLKSTSPSVNYSRECHTKISLSTTQLRNVIMSSWLRVFALLLAVSSLAMARNIERYGRHNNPSDNFDLNDLTPPQDPAVNRFPKEPVAPMVPNCARTGYFRDPYNCAKFYRCQHRGANPETYYCQHGWIFDEINETCNDPSLVRC